MDYNREKKNRDTSEPLLMEFYLISVHVHVLTQSRWMYPYHIHVYQYQSIDIGSDFWVYLYLELRQSGLRRRPTLYQISLFSLYILITILTILYTSSVYHAITSQTMLELSFQFPVSKLDANFFSFLTLK